MIQPCFPRTILIPFFQASFPSSFTPHLFSIFFFSRLLIIPIPSDSFLFFGPTTRCPVLFMTGALASHNNSVKNLYEALQASLKNDPIRRTKVELVQVDGVANVMRERVS
ncbi:unnamed protein product [Protopolystoma xenopodis]|uniref:Uncharacterized protein n=1 Tax=Protopolystoma xenopodis TaxID=117903 RepID=A0A3S5BNK6_9PLAT|nr:unnamed protein product [Protopolystoma xenopodis]